jgi:hypothetical protein
MCRSPTRRSVQCDKSVFTTVRDIGTTTDKPLSGRWSIEVLPPCIRRCCAKRKEGTLLERDRPSLHRLDEARCGAPPGHLADRVFECGKCGHIRVIPDA